MSSRFLFQHLSKTIRPYPRTRTPFLSTPSSTPFRFFHASTAKMAVIEFKSKADFDSAVKASKIVIVDASASWCGPCKVIAPIYAKLSDDEKFKGVTFAKFDVDEVAELAQYLTVTAMPTFFAIKDGETVGTIQGANPSALTQLIEQAL